MERGYVKLWRKTLDSGLMQNDNAFRLFGYLLMNVAFTEKKISSDGQITVLHPGQAIFSRKRIADFLNISEQNARTALKFLEKLEILTSKPTNRFTVISFVNWDTYQNEKITANQQTNQQLTDSSPTVNQQVTTVLECKNVRMEECKNINTAPQGARVAKFVKPTVEEVDAYCKERGNGITGQEFVDHYEAVGWVYGTGKKPVKDWKACVRTWENNRKKQAQRPQTRTYTTARVRQGEFDMSRQINIAHDIIAEMEAEDAIRSNAGQATQTRCAYGYGSQLR